MEQTYSNRRQHVKQDSARKPESHRCPRGESQFVARIRHPFLDAAREQFRRPGAHGRKWKARCDLIRQVCRGFAKMGPDATASMLSRFLHIPLRTVERGTAWALATGFIENVYEHKDWKRRAGGRFDGDRMIRALHPELLLPQDPVRKQTPNPWGSQWVNSVLPLECGGTVPPECGGYNSPNSNSDSQEGGGLGVGGGLGSAGCLEKQKRLSDTQKPREKERFCFFTTKSFLKPPAKTGAEECRDLLNGINHAVMIEPGEQIKLLGYLERRAMRRRRSNYVSRTTGEPYFPIVNMRAYFAQAAREFCRRFVGHQRQAILDRFQGSTLKYKNIRWDYATQQWFVDELPKPKRRKVVEIVMIHCPRCSVYKPWQPVCPNCGHVRGQAWREP
jgi:hypothetical protein